MKVDIYSDIACPWCYVGKKRFEQALAAFEGPVEVTYHPYQLDPSLPADPAEALPSAEYLKRRGIPNLEAAQRRLGQLAEGLGIHFAWDRALSTNTLTGHRLVWWAAREAGAEGQARMKEALLRAHFSEGRNLSDVEALVAIAQAAGFEAEATRAFLKSDAGVAEVRDDIEAARALGVTSVPTYVFEGQWAVAGAQEVETFLQVLRQVASETA